MWDRQNFGVSKWHILELIRLNEKGGGYGLTIKQVQTYFDLRHMDKVIKKLNQLKYLTRIPKPFDKPWHGWVYKLSEPSHKFLRKHNLDTTELGFLHPSNPYLAKSKMICNAKRKLWKDELVDVPESM